MDVLESSGSYFLCGVGFVSGAVVRRGDVFKHIEPLFFMGIIGELRSR